MHPAYAVGRRIHFSKQYWYITNHLHMYVTNYYTCVCTATIVPWFMCLTLVNVNVSSNMTFASVVIFAKINSDPVGLFLMKIMLMNSVL